MSSFSAAIKLVLAQIDAGQIDAEFFPSTRGVKVRVNRLLQDVFTDGYALTWEDPKEEVRPPLDSVGFVLRAKVAQGAQTATFHVIVCNRLTRTSGYGLPAPVFTGCDDTPPAGEERVRADWERSLSLDGGS